MSFWTCGIAEFPDFFIWYPDFFEVDSPDFFVADFPDSDFEFLDFFQKEFPDFGPSEFPDLAVDRVGGPGDVAELELRLDLNMWFKK